MSEMFNPIVFYVTAIFIIVSAIFAVKSRNIFYSLLFAIAVFFAVGALFYVLGAEYNAVIQVAIYGVAVPVILGVAIMFTDLKNKISNAEWNFRSVKTFALLAGGLFILALVHLFLKAGIVEPDIFEIADNVGYTPLPSVNIFGQGIFVKYVFAFELISIILTIVAVGLTLFKKEGRKNKCLK